MAAMRLALEVNEPGDHVVATGVLQSLHELVELAFSAAGVDDPWSHVRQDTTLLRPGDAPGPVGDPAGALAALAGALRRRSSRSFRGWSAPTSSAYKGSRSLPSISSALSLSLRDTSCVHTEPLPEVQVAVVRVLRSPAIG